MRQSAMRIELLLMIHKPQASCRQKKVKGKIENRKRKENSMPGRKKNNHEV
jgi:hypothetical protein